MTLNFDQTPLTSLSHFLFDEELGPLMVQEDHRQRNTLELIASENFASPAVLAAQGSILTNKYAEGYPGRRYYGGCEVVDKIETLAIERAKKLFKCAYANVQPYSGSQANQAVFLAVLKPGDTFLSLDLSSGGHLTHGSKVNLSGLWFHAVHYGVTRQGRIDMDQVRALAHHHRPKLIIAGASAYPWILDFKAFRAIADEIDAILLVDMAHIAGLVCTDLHPSPLPHAHVVTSTTHKTLRGPRSGLILSNDLQLGKKLNSAIFPGLQGGPHVHAIAAKAVCFQEALTPSFKVYAQAILDNAKALAQGLMDRGLSVVGQGTENHLLLLDVTSHNLTGNQAQSALEAVGITCNKNAIPYDPNPPQTPSGLRLGTPAVTTRGLTVEHMGLIAQWTQQRLSAPEADPHPLLDQVHRLMQAYPLPYEQVK